MATFMLLLKVGDFTRFSPEEMQKIVMEYFEWGNRLRAEGKYRGGDELKEGGRVLSVRDGRIADGPFAETKEVVGGYFLLEEASLDAATSLSRSCPHLKFGGSIEIREINPHQ